MFTNEFLNVESSEINHAPVPAGEYSLRCEKAELKDTKKPGGQYISAQFKIVSEEQNGRFIFANFNVKNEVAQAVEIGHSELKSFLENSGVNPAVLVGKTFEAAAQMMVSQVVGAIIKHKASIYNGVTETKAEISYYTAHTAEGKQMMATKNNPAGSSIPDQAGANSNPF